MPWKIRRTFAPQSVDKAGCGAFLYPETWYHFWRMEFGEWSQPQSYKISIRYERTDSLYFEHPQYGKLRVVVEEDRIYYDLFDVKKIFVKTAQQLYQVIADSEGELKTSMW